jgi:hypothetical protein
MIGVYDQGRDLPDYACALVAIASFVVSFRRLLVFTVDTLATAASGGTPNASCQKRRQAIYLSIHFCAEPTILGTKYLVKAGSHYHLRERCQGFGSSQRWLESRVANTVESVVCVV